jgi:hypothetical protein
MSDELFTRVIEVKDIQNRKNSQIVVIDSAGNEYSTINLDDYKHIVNQPHEYIGKTWRIKFGVAKRKFLDFYGFQEEVEDEEPNTEEINPEDLVGPESMGIRDKQITRQSAVHDATRLVQGMIENGDFDTAKQQGGKQQQREEIKKKVEYWTQYFKQHHRTGDFPQ